VAERRGHRHERASRLPRRAHRPPRREETLVHEIFHDVVTRYALACVAILFALGMLAIRAWLAKIGDLPGDQAVAARWPDPRTPEPFTELAEFYGTMASPLVAIVTVALTTWIVWRRAGRRYGLGVLIAAFAVVVNAICKTVFGPTQLYATLTPTGVNYPSGHVTYATAVFGYIAYIGLEKRRPEAAVVAFVVIAGMGPARILDGSHLPSDVAGAYLLGLAWLIGTILWVTRR
jgi:membrane-associated phospholipid phosphatase